MPLTVRACVVEPLAPAALAEVTELAAKLSRTTLSPGPPSSMSWPGPPMQHVVAVAAEQGVVAGAAEQDVVAVAAVER